MLLGLPHHLAPQSSSQAISRACLAIAATVLSAAAVIIVSVQVARAALILWPALAALVPLLGLLVVVARNRSTSATLAYLIIGSAAIYLYSITVFSQIGAISSSDAFSMTLPKLALILVGGSAVVARRGLVWATCGYVGAELATQVAAVQNGASARLDVTTLLGYLLVLAATGSAYFARRRAGKVQPNLHRAAHDEQVSALRFEIEQQAAALLHDTVLNHLAALSVSRAGSLDPDLVGSVQTDLATLVGQEWLHTTEDTSAKSIDDWQSTELSRAISRVREQGLDVAVTGDLDAVVGLGTARGKALGLAVAQCLVNVIKHAGTTSAEVVVIGSSSVVSVMVIDNGVGFTPDQTPGDRLGIKNSVKARIERAGGAVHIWSSHGSGTSVLIDVPRETAAGSTGGPEQTRERSRRANDDAMSAGGESFRVDDIRGAPDKIGDDETDDDSLSDAEGAA